MNDLFGEPVALLRKGTTPSGYARLPGSGPTGETCATCAYAVRAGRYAKCAKMRARWTHGIKTDIRLRSPACSEWEADCARFAPHVNPAREDGK